jgi:hypothetical protein
MPEKGIRKMRKKKKHCDVTSFPFLEPALNN